MTEFEARFFQQLYPSATIAEYERDKHSVTFINGYSAYTSAEAINYLSENYPT